jgi:hypothetical protein
MFHNIHKQKRDNRLPIILILCSVLGVFLVNGSAATMTMTMAYAQTVVPVPKHTFAYEIGAKNGLAAGKAGLYDVGAACASFTGNDLEHCIAGYHDAVAGYHDAVAGYHDAVAGYHNSTNNAGMNNSR